MTQLQRLCSLGSRPLLPIRLRLWSKLNSDEINRTDGKFEIESQKQIQIVSSRQIGRGGSCVVLESTHVNDATSKIV